MTEVKQFLLTAKQLAAQAIFTTCIHIMLFGGSRSGKTFLIIRNIVFRALKAPGSRHAILRFRFNHVKSSIIFDTFPKVMALCFPSVYYKLSKSDWYVTIPIVVPDPTEENPEQTKVINSEIWFGGLDDKERTEKILGNEYATIFLCECSQLSWHSRNIVLTRLAQAVVQVIVGLDNVQLIPKLYYDCNPPNKNHWTYLYFIKKLDPDTKKPLDNPEEIGFFQMNPKDNVENLPPGYIKMLEGMGTRMKARFLEGRFADANPNALFSEEWIDRWRVLNRDEVPQLLRVVIAVDPSGAGDEENAHNDAIGIVAGGLGIDGNVYILGDFTVKAGPGTWGRIVGEQFDLLEADVVVGEINYGGAMVNHVVQTARPRTPYQTVTATRGKTVRAEPASALYETGKVRHVGFLQELEDELTSFSTVGYLGDSSPNRADAAIWVIAALLPGVIQKAAGPAPVVTAESLKTVNLHAKAMTTR